MEDLLMKLAMFNGQAGKIAQALQSFPSRVVQAAVARPKTAITPLVSPDAEISGEATRSFTPDANISRKAGQLKIGSEGGPESGRWWSSHLLPSAVTSRPASASR